MDFEKIRPYNKLVTTICKEYAMDPYLVLAIIYQESRGNTYAERYEPDFKSLLDVKYFAKKNLVTEDTEIISQKTSRGLCQIMGGTARYLGFGGYLAELFVPHINIRLCIKFLCRLFQRHGHQSDVIASYNAGSPRFDADGRYKNQTYVDNVLRYHKTLRSGSSPDA